MRLLSAGTLAGCAALLASCGGAGNDVIPADGATVMGVVTFEDTRFPLADVTVSIGPSSATSAETGGYTLGRVAAGVQTLTASKDGFEPYSLEIDVVAPETTHDIQLTSATGSTSVSGTVRDSETLVPLGGARVSIAGMAKFTDAGGNYELGSVPQGTHPVEVERLEYYDFSSTIDLGPAPEVRDVDLDWVYYRGNWKLTLDCGGCPLEGFNPLELVVNVATLNGSPSELVILTCPDQTWQVAASIPYPASQPFALPAGLAFCVDDHVVLHPTFERLTVSGTFELTSGNPGCYTPVSGTFTGTRDDPHAVCS